MNKNIKLDLMSNEKIYIQYESRSSANGIRSGRQDIWASLFHRLSYSFVYIFTVWVVTQI